MDTPENSEIPELHKKLNLLKQGKTSELTEEGVEEEAGKDAKERLGERREVSTTSSYSRTNNSGGGSSIFILVILISIIVANYNAIMKLLSFYKH